MAGRDIHHTTIMVASKATGKSTELCRIALKYPKASKVLIIDVNGSAAYNCIKEIQLKDLKYLTNGRVKIVGTPDEETLEFIAKTFRNGLVIFEDCTKYINSNLSKGVKTFLTDHRMMGCDLIFTFHSIRRIPRQFWEMTSYVIIGKTHEVFEDGANKNRIPNYENVLKAWKNVMANPSPYYKETVETFV
ncbi:hypothetical protein [Pedobacter cryophilus]|uniref:AAA+ ATPase domain-containing protein n=1 Tax=Pedobacter cryophilus TaxID=2571271 RepID=A0A4U1C1C8_9SPHI|nr:hypothetical protein [Pedobacter cryophilus]TKB96857.1 hypothetical protein FA046_12325 [Pedobacter cryophilus]